MTLSKRQIAKLTKGNPNRHIANEIGGWAAGIMTDENQGTPLERERQVAGWAEIAVNRAYLTGKATCR